MRVIHVITGLNDGGAEAVLFRLCINDATNQHAVISLMDMGKYGPLLIDNNIEVYCLNMPQGYLTLSGFRQLYSLFKKNKPDAVQTWMYHADLLGGLVARLAGIKNINWGVHHTTLEKNVSKKSTIYIAKICAVLSYLIPKKIIFCANKGAEVHAQLGYNKSKIEIVSNGYELDHFVIKKYLGKAIKDEFLINDAQFIIGMVGRYDPLKDHDNLLAALVLVQNKVPSFKCLLVGKLLDLDNNNIVEKIDRLGLCDNVLLLGQRTDIPSIMNALDIHILSSYSEAFPNVLSEAMACGTPCVTTDVGDAALIVGETGWVVPPCNPQELAHAILVSFNEIRDVEKWQERQLAARQRIVENFSIQNMIDRYHEVWQK